MESEPATPFAAHATSAVYTDVLDESSDQSEATLAYTIAVHKTPLASSPTPPTESEDTVTSSVSVAAAGSATPTDTT